ncbi:MAG TPA: lysine--tRNA ligase [Kineosporiaceae bacterium]|nr:lysine--tRNA ligase [Kineosporiaceae bacterium]
MSTMSPPAPEVAAALPTDGDWVARFADEVIAEAERRAPGRPIVCASGISPSGPIHLGNLREVLTPHFVADEIRRRGRDAVHLLSWDDYDRFRRVPAGVDPAWAAHVGKPLTSVPAPPGSPHANWAEHFKAPLVAALDQLGVEVSAVSQTQRYTGGAYTEQILLAARERERIDAILGRYRTRRIQGQVAHPGAEEDGSGAAADDDGGSAFGYFPYKPYCVRCGRDTTTVTGYDDVTTAMTYVCDDGSTETVLLRDFRRGKLVWKVDWPMRWAYEGVVFEPSGVDHQSPGSSFVVGGQLVRDVFGAEPPIGPMYAFVGISGMAKMSSSRGAVPIPLDALQIMEAPLLRWLYVRRRPNQSITVAFDQEVQRLYDEWDAVARKVARAPSLGGDLPAGPPAGEVAGYARSIGTATRTLESTPHPLPYRTLASVVDVTTGDPEQTLRILRDLDPDDPVTSLDDVRPRLDRAATWVATQVPPEQRTHVREAPDVELLAALGGGQRAALRLLLDGLDTHWSLEAVTSLVYGVPKVLAGLPPDARPTPELKAAQREFFALLYRLLIGRDTGPRLPTLLLAIGPERIGRLLTPPA